MQNSLRASLKLLDKIIPGHHLTESKVHKAVHAAVREHGDLVHDASVKLHHEEDGQAQRSHEDDVLNAWDL